MIDLKERAKKLKTDIPAVFIALKQEKTPVLAKILAGLTVAYALPIIIFWLVIILLIVKAVFL